MTNDAGMVAVSEENEHVTRRYTEELINQRSLSVADEIFSPDFVSHAAEDGQPADLEALKQFFVMLCAGFPDFRCTVEDLFTVGDRLAFRFTFVGTHEGEFMGIAPTGKRVTMPGIDILRIADGKIAEL